MATPELHIIHHDKEKSTVVIGYVYEPKQALPPHTLKHATENFLEQLNIKVTRFNVIPLQAFKITLDQQRAMIAFMTDNQNHNVVKAFIKQHNNTKKEWAAIVQKQEFYRHTKSLVDEILVDVMLAQVE